MVDDQGMNQQYPCTDDQTTIGEIKYRPVNFVKVQKITDTVENNSIVQVAQRAAENQTQRGAKPAVGRRRLPKGPDDDASRGDQADRGKDLVGAAFVLAAQPE